MTHIGGGGTCSPRDHFHELVYLSISDRYTFLDILFLIRISTAKLETYRKEVWKGRRKRRQRS